MTRACWAACGRDLAKTVHVDLGGRDLHACGSGQSGGCGSPMESGPRVRIRPAGHAGARRGADSRPGSCYSSRLTCRAARATFSKPQTSTPAGDGWERVGDFGKRTLRPAAPRFEKGSARRAGPPRQVGLRADWSDREAWRVRLTPSVSAARVARIRSRLSRKPADRQGDVGHLESRRSRDESALASVEAAARGSAHHPPMEITVEGPAGRRAPAGAAPFSKPRRARTRSSV